MCKCLYRSVVVVFICIIFFFKQKTAYEMRISDWSSDVVSSDLRTCSGGEANLYNENFAIYSILIVIIEYLLYDIYSEKLSNQVFKELFSPKRYSCSLPAICRRQAKLAAPSRPMRVHAHSRPGRARPPKSEAD